MNIIFRLTQKMYNNKRNHCEIQIQVKVHNYHLVLNII